MHFVLSKLYAIDNHVWLHNNPIILKQHMETLDMVRQYKFVDLKLKLMLTKHPHVWLKLMMIFSTHSN